MQLQAIHQIDERYTHVYIAPHFDDAALSCGGSIARHSQQGEPVLVITVCGGYPDLHQLTEYAQELHEQWGAVDDPISTRRAEDASALALLGSDTLWLPEFDAIYRHKRYAESEDNLFGPQAADDPLPAALRQHLALMIERAPQATYYFPLGIGGHVDHRVAYAAAGALIDKGMTVMFYEDLPYATGISATERIAELGSAFTPLTLDISATLALKLAAIAEYRSQVPVLFGDEETMIGDITRYAASIALPGMAYAERLWLPGDRSSLL